jgi:hypothetical protein
MVKVDKDVRMAGLLNMSLEEWLKDRVKEIEIGISILAWHRESEILTRN